jgi:CRP-like cAMP-binding protein
MGDLTQSQFEQALRRGERDLVTKPRAKTARYDRETGRIVVDLTSGATFAFPAMLAQGLEQASAEALEQVEIAGAGFGLHWEVLDVDLTIEGLLAGRFGSARYMAERFGGGWDSEAAE